MGWSGIQNGKLLALAIENGFDVFITGDRSLMFQRNTGQLSIAVIVLETKGTQLHQTLPLMAKVIALLPDLTPGTVERVSEG